MEKIGIMGAHGTGKTTLAFELAHKKKKANPRLNVGILPEIARKCPYPINKNISPMAQLWIWHKQMLAEIEIRNCDISICDRTVLDSLAYSQYIGFYWIIDNYLKQSIDWLGTYSEIHWLRPTSHGITDDGVRDIDIEFQERIDNILAGWIKEFKIKTIGRKI